METQSGTMVDLLQEMLEIESVNQVIVIGKDGFVIESIGNQSVKDIEKLGAGLAESVNEMGKISAVLNVGELDNVTVTFEGAYVIGMATPDAVIVAIATDNSSSGLMRIKMNALIPRLEQLL